MEDLVATARRRTRTAAWELSLAREEHTQRMTALTAKRRAFEQTIEAEHAAVRAAADRVRLLEHRVEACARDAGQYIVTGVVCPGVEVRQRDVVYIEDNLSAAFGREIGL